MTSPAWVSQGTASAPYRWIKTATYCGKPRPSGPTSAPSQEVEEFFKKVDPDEWYLTTGNGFPAACYTIFKVMWYQRNEPEMWKKVYKILGTKDFLNYKLTGRFITDFSYASGTGIYNLQQWSYEDKFIDASGIPAAVWPNIVPSTQVLGGILPDVAETLGLSDHVQVVCGGVDNSCMALGARNTP